MATMIIYLHWENLTTTLTIKPTLVFSEVVKYYFRNQGFNSADFLYKGKLLNLDMTIKQLKLESGAKIYIKNATVTDISNHHTLEIKLYESASNGYRSMGKRCYLIRSDKVRCDFIVSALQSDLGTKRPVHIVNGPVIVGLHEYIDIDATIVAVMG